MDLSPSIIGYVRDNIDEYKALVKDLPNELSKAKELYESNGE